MSDAGETMSEGDARRAIDAVWRIESARLIAGLARLVRDVGIARIARTAGFDGIGLRAENYWDAESSGLDGSAMAELAGEAGVPVLEVEYITAWGTSTDRDADQQRKEQAVFSMARTFGVRHVNTGLLERLPVDVIVEAFAELCDRAGELTIALEFMPYSGVPDLATAWRILQEADRPNSALIIDVWLHALVIRS